MKLYREVELSEDPKLFMPVEAIELAVPIQTIVNQYVGRWIPLDAIVEAVKIHIFSSPQEELDKEKVEIWICPSCFCSQYITHQKCMMCGTPQPK